MFCPVCKAEYRLGFTHCSDCDVDLVEHLPDNLSGLHNQDLAVAWRGTDPSAFSAALAALKGAGIHCVQISDHDQLAWGLAVPKPRYEILVRRSDLPGALDLVAQFGERAAWAQARDIWKGETDFLEDEPDQANETPGEGAPQQVPDDIPPKIKPKEATSIVWSGADPQFSNDIKGCLAENGIACVVADDGSRQQVSVRPTDETRAKEIIREVIEATPPE